MSPSFECTLDGLRSAVRLRHTLMGVPSPEQAAARYMRGYAISSAAREHPETLRKRIEIIIGDIEHLTSCEEPETCGMVVHAAMVPPDEMGRRRTVRLRTSRDRLTLTD